MNEQNRKIKQTNSMLGNALFKLLEKKSLEEITVAELVSVSSVSKSTFYNHYKSQIELFEKIANDTISGYNNAFIAMKADIRKGFGMLIAIIKLNKEKNRHLFGYYPFRKMLVDKIKNSLIESGENPLISEYKSNGMVSAIVKWVCSDYQDNIDIIGGLL